MSKNYYVYIITTKKNTVLYTGVTKDLRKRIESKKKSQCTLQDWIWGFSQWEIDQYQSQSQCAQYRKYFYISPLSDGRHEGDWLGPDRAYLRLKNFFQSQKHP